MFRFAVFVALLAGCYASPRIVNGTDAKEGEIPYIISLRHGSSHSCGGSILDATHVLTASHCVDGSTNNPSAFKVQYGVLKIGGNQNVVGVKSIVMHPEYSPFNNYANDVAVITLDGEIKFGDNVRPTILPQPFSATPGDKTAVLAGWGYPYSGGNVMQNLQRVDIICYTDANCESAHHGSTDREVHVCAGIPEGGKGQCSGDSGGPLTVDGVQVGVVSWSVKPCTVKGYPGVFARVANYVDWIKKQL
ncbi:PREDICTED: chymotrypsin-1-like [Nicrophorus vespilloides]|uniref:Chymotrypsin-1-like n=1 Tax=Nicrophorus vespilloides TaxID=110193 RepID=A0ABM1MPU6_NICVS|nr:PREDICTED: chymotrypsin-1-like [Nicrophorus vespilloides]